MKKMKKSALAAAVLLSLSMMGSVYAADDVIDVPVGGTVIKTGDLNIVASDGMSAISFNNVDKSDDEALVSITSDGSITLYSSDVAVKQGSRSENDAKYNTKLNIDSANLAVISKNYGIVSVGGNNITRVNYNAQYSSTGIVDIKGVNYDGAKIDGWGIYLKGETDDLSFVYVDGDEVNICGGYRGIQVENGKLMIGSKNFSADVNISAGRNGAINPSTNGVVYIDAQNILISSVFDKDSSSVICAADSQLLINQNEENKVYENVMLQGRIATQSNSVAKIKGKTIEISHGKNNLIGCTSGSTIELEGNNVSIVRQDKGEVVKVNGGGFSVKGLSGDVKSNVMVMQEGGNSYGTVNNSGTMTLDGNGGTMTFNSGDITNNGIINIAGKVNMNVGSVANVINVKEGAELNVVTTVNADNGLISTSTLKDITFEDNGGTKGTAIRTIDMSIDLDASGSSIKGDTLKYEGTFAGNTLNLKRINIIEDATANYSNKEYQLVTGNSKTLVEINDAKAVTDTAVYTITGSENTGKISLTCTIGGVTLTDVISGDDYKDIGSYSMSKDATVSDKSLGSLNGDGRELTIYGNGHTINGNNKGGVTIQASMNQVLNLVDVASMTGFNGNAIANNAGGTVNVEGDFYADKVSNTGTMNLGGTTYIDQLTVGSGAKINVATQLFSNTVTAIGSNNTMGAEHTYALGEDNKVMGEKSVAVGFANEVNGKGSGAFGDPNVVYGDGSYAFGNNNKIGTAEKYANNSFAVGNNTTVSSSNSVALGNGSTVTEDNVVSVGSETQQRKIVNVADGEDAHDAATVGQVVGVADNLQGEINTLNGQIDRMGTRINKVGAGAAALAAMHPVYDEDSKLTFSAGLGAYRNEKAAAVGMFFRFSPRVMMNAGATVGNDNNMYNVGLNFALDRHVRGGLPSKAVMAKQLTAQSAEIADLKAQMAQQQANHDAQIAKLMALIEELKNK